MTKFTRCCSAFKRFAWCLLLLLPYSSFSQQTVGVNVERIEQKLLALADSASTGLNETANFSVSNVSIQDFVRGVAETHNLNISIDPALDIRITNNFTNVKVINIILFLCREYQLDIRFIGNIISFYKYVSPQEVKAAPPPKRLNLSYDANSDLLTTDLLNDSLTTFAKQVTQATKKNVVLAPGLNGRLVNGYIEAMPLGSALEKIAYANNLKFYKTEDNAFVLTANEEAQSAAAGRDRNNNPTQRQPTGQGRSFPMGTTADSYIKIEPGADGQRYISVDAINTPILDLVKDVSEKLGINYVLFSDPPGNTTIRVKRIRYDDFLGFLLQGTTHTHKLLDGIYLIGERNLEGFRTTRLLRLQFRPAEKIDEVIPAELKKGVDIKIFKELNGIIMSGGTPQIAEISEFLKAIDQPVLNVMIEVIVIDVRKGHSVTTGVKAGLSDKDVQTSGTVFPGLDMTLSSRSINSVLSKLAGKGIINLGQVTPSFYITLQALEENNFLKIRSTPKLSTLNGHEANLTIGKSVYYLEQTQNINGSISTTTTVTQQYKKVEANLNIKINPMVSGDEHITLEVGAEFSDFVAPEIKGAPPGNATRKFNSMIRIKNEEMIVLGGLEEVRNANSGSGVPLLSRIPIIKWLFSSRVSSKSNNRLIVFIKPTIVY